MAKERSFLEQRADQRKAEREARKAEMQGLRQTNMGAYIESLSGGNGTLGSSRPEAPLKKLKQNRSDEDKAAAKQDKANSKQEKQGSRLVQEMQAIGMKLNGGSRAEIEGRRRERESMARVARERDIDQKMEVKRAQQSQESFKMVANVFKDNGEKMIRAINDLAKKMKKEESKSGGKERGLLDQYRDWRDKKKRTANDRRRRRSESRNRPSRSRGPARSRNRRPGRVGRPDDYDDSFDIEDFDDDLPDRERDRDRPRSKRDIKRDRRLKRMRSRGRGGKGLRGAWNRARGFGSRLFGGASEAAGGARNAAGGIRGAAGAAEAAGAAGRGGGLLSRAGSLLSGGGVLGTAARVLGGVGAAADVAYNSAPLVGQLFDSKEDTMTRIGAGAHLATTAAGGVIGGVLGGPTGAAYGAWAGDKVASGASWLGRKIADNTDVYGAIHDKDGIVNRASTAVSGTLTAVQQSALGRTLGTTAAIAMAPFSADAREALKKDWEMSILPKLDETFESMTNRIGNLASAFGQASSQIYSSVKDAGKSAWSGVKDAASQIADGYKKDGITGALKAVDGTATKVGRGIYKGATQLKEGAISAGSTLNYGLKKGTASNLDLAMGFSAKKGFSGLSDSESKAYAANVMKTESGGQVDIVNPYGFSGQYQFGADALADQGIIDKDKLAAAKKAAGGQWYKGGLHKQFMEDNANWKNEGGRDKFLNDKQLQDDLFVQYTNKNIAAGYKSGALNANSSSEDIAGYAKAAHLKGTGGANNYFLKGIDSTDANGTKVSDYAKGASSSMKALAAKVDDAKAKGILPADKTMLASGDKKEPEAAAANKSSIRRNADGSTTMLAKATPMDSPVKGSAIDPNAPKGKVIGALETKTPSIGQTLQEQMQVAKSDTRVTGASTLAATSAVRARSDDSAYSVTPITADPIPTATASAQPMQMLAPQTPAEISTVNVANQPAPVAPVSNTVVQGGGGKAASQPTLDDLPLMINDMGLVLLNIGHV